MKHSRLFKYLLNIGNQACEKDSPPTGNPVQKHSKDTETYEPPQLIVHDGDEFIKGLGPAQACSPTPDLF